MAIWLCSLGYDPRPTPSLLRVGMKLSDPDLLKTAKRLIIIWLQGVAGNKKPTHNVMNLSLVLCALQ
jgi:hypothetical protein